jgi:glutathione S-transferase
MHPRPLSIAIERLMVRSHRGQTDEDKLKAAVAPVKTALEAIESLTVGHRYLLGHELSIVDF